MKPTITTQSRKKCYKSLTLNDYRRSLPVHYTPENLLQAQNHENIPDCKNQSQQLLCQYDEDIQQNFGDDVVLSNANSSSSESIRCNAIGIQEDVGNDVVLSNVNICSSESIRCNDEDIQQDFWNDVVFPNANNSNSESHEQNSLSNQTNLSSMNELTDNVQSTQIQHPNSFTQFNNNGPSNTQSTVSTYTYWIKWLSKILITGLCLPMILQSQNLESMSDSFSDSSYDVAVSISGFSSITSTTTVNSTNITQDELYSYNYVDESAESLSFTHELSQQFQNLLRLTVGVCPWCGRFPYFYPGSWPSNCCRKRKDQKKLLKPVSESLRSVLRQFNQYDRPSIKVNQYLSLGSYGGKRRQLPGRADQAYVLHGYTYSRIIESKSNFSTSFKVSGRAHNPIEWIMTGFHSQIQAFNTSSWYQKIVSELRDNNPIFRAFCSFETLLKENKVQEGNIIIHQGPKDGNEDDIGAIIVRPDGNQKANSRTLVFNSLGSDVKFLSANSPYWFPLLYPLFAINGEYGWSKDNSKDKTLLEWCSSLILREWRFRELLELTGQFITDCFSKVEDIRAEFDDLPLLSVQDTEEDGGTPSRIFLPASFTGSIAWFKQKLEEAVSMLSRWGTPHFWITLTSNINWKEFLQAYPSHLGTPSKRIRMLDATAAAQIFNGKIQLVLRNLKQLLCDPQWYILVTEWQQRGLAHGHLQVRCKSYDFPDIKNYPELMDKYVSARLPVEPGKLQDVVEAHMIHGHYPKCAPIINGRCRKHYPQPITAKSHYDSRGRAVYRRGPNDRYVVPYCPKLLLAWDGHANCEVSAGSRALSYLFGYQHKGSDRVAYSEKFKETGSEYSAMRSGRYLSSHEAAYRLMGFSVVRQWPSITTIDVWTDSQRRADKLKRYRKTPGSTGWKGLMDFWFDRPEEEAGTDPVTYLEKYIVQQNKPPRLRGPKDKKRHFKLRTFPIGSEAFYCSVILDKSIALHSIRTYDDIKSNYISCRAKLEDLAPQYLNDQRHWTKLFFEEEIKRKRSSSQLRKSIVLLVTHLEWTFDNVKPYMEHIIVDLEDEEQGQAVAISKILKSLEYWGFDINLFISTDKDHPIIRKAQAILAPNDIGTQDWMELPDKKLLDRGNRNLRWPEPGSQLYAFNIVMSIIKSQISSEILIQAWAGTGKSFLLNSIIRHMHIEYGQESVVSCGSTGVASSGLYNSLTCHKKYKLQIKEMDDPTDITPDLSKIKGVCRALSAAQLFIIDEVFMLTKRIYLSIREAISSCRGSKFFVILAVGDYLQFPPVVDTRFLRDVHLIDLFQKFEKIELAQPQRHKHDIEFFKFLKVIALGAFAVNDIYLQFPRYDFEKSVSFLWPQLNFFAENEFSLRSPIYKKMMQTMIGANFLSPINKDCYEVTQFLSEQWIDTTMEIAWATTTITSMSTGYEQEIKYDLGGTVPREEIPLKKGMVYILYANTIHGSKYSQHILVEHSVQRNRIVLLPVEKYKKGHIGSTFSLPRFIFKKEVQADQITITRKQFPIALGGCLTVHKSQGATLERVVLYYRDTEGPGGWTLTTLYVGLSRVRSHKDVAFTGEDTSLRFRVERDVYWNEDNEWDYYPDDWDTNPTRFWSSHPLKEAMNNTDYISDIDMYSTGRQSEMSSDNDQSKST